MALDMDRNDTRSKGRAADSDLSSQTYSCKGMLYSTGSSVQRHQSEDATKNNACSEIFQEGLDKGATDKQN